ncbi:hypothetical protein E2I00_009771, partial [Balaenoptera physalus]
VLWGPLRQCEGAFFESSPGQTRAQYGLKLLCAFYLLSYKPKERENNEIVILPPPLSRPKGHWSPFSLASSSLTGREVLTPFPGLGTAPAPAQGGAHLKQPFILLATAAPPPTLSSEGSRQPLSPLSSSLPIPPGPGAGFKETAFLYAVSSAALTHTLARACSAGRMERCTCDDSPGLESRQAWQWGVCGDNLKYSTKVCGPGSLTTPPFCLSSQAVKSGLRTTCKCHGVSGSCAVRTCWKQLSPFRETGQVLKLRHDSAVKVSSATNEALGRLELWAPARAGSSTKGPAPRPGDLASCSSLCCGRGYDTQSRLVAFSCHCQVQWCCYVECQQCVQEELVYTCKH